MTHTNAFDAAMAPRQRLVDELNQIAEEASDAFWRVVAERFPEIKHGDFGPLETHEWRSACERAIQRWVSGNMPAYWSAERAGEILRDLGAEVDWPTPGGPECWVPVFQTGRRDPGPRIIVTDNEALNGESGWMIGHYPATRDDEANATFYLAQTPTDLIDTVRAIRTLAGAEA